MQVHISFFDKCQEKWRNLHNNHVFIFYLLYVDHLIANIFRWFSVLTFRTIEKLYFVLSYFRFYDMNFFHWNLMPWEGFTPKYFSSYANFQPGKFLENCLTEIIEKSEFFQYKYFSWHQFPKRKNSSYRLWRNSEQRVTFKLYEMSANLLFKRYSRLNGIRNVNKI